MGGVTDAALMHRKARGQTRWPGRQLYQQLRGCWATSLASRYGEAGLPALHEQALSSGPGNAEQTTLPKFRKAEAKAQFRDWPVL